MTARITIEEIAKQANTSPSTVSLVLRNRPGVGGETRERVLAVAKELGYRRRLPAPVGDDRRVLNVGLVLRSWRSLESAAQAGSPALGPFYSWVVLGIESAARNQRMNLLLATLAVDGDNQVVELPHQLLDQPLDGILLVGSFRPEAVAAVSAGNARPIVLIDAEVGEHEHDTISSDNEGGARAAVTYLIESGHRRIAFVGPPAAVSANFSQRRGGYLRALAEHGISDTSIEDHEVAADDAVGAVIGLLRRNPEITAIFGANDDHAIAAIRAAQEIGRRVPDDLSVIGFDDITGARDLVPALTTMAVDKVGMGRLAVQTLTYRLAWPESAPVMTILRPQLVVRGTVAPRSKPRRSRSRQEGR